MKLVLLALAACSGSPASHTGAGPDAAPSSHPDAPAEHADAPPASFARVFATHTVYMGAFGGLADGDQLCNSAAETAGLGGTWKAWLSDSTSNAIDRLADVGPWYLVDEATEVFAGKAALVESPLVAIDHDEYGHAIAQSNPFNVEGAWTGTLQDGTAGASDPSIGQGADCADWKTAFGETAMFGNVLDTSTWTNVGAGQLALCDEEQEHLYCFEQ
ncbi:MAG TPA: hypothetical protein VLX92_08800 [Kofleriaceae bacterium]|nr:hypothetical protein [Kofleriaceae bacterium]